ncbi:hypothetical protein GCM10009096_04220 [Parasphingorhabdus litoris]|uniref:UrcA family protein n=1 Tax=Parasphingorhabdus litoris TaxID=394733 RepID=A0ABN1A3H1_9SPHN|nr:hypothetical protein [Parasphingorhabdus litoris]
MHHLPQSRILSRSAGISFTLAGLLAIVALTPAKAEKSDTRKKASSATVYVRAQIYKRIEIRPENFSKTEKQMDQNLLDVSQQDCDPEVRKMIKNCVLMIYEMQ